MLLAAQNFWRLLLFEEEREKIMVGDEKIMNLLAKGKHLLASLLTKNAGFKIPDNLETRATTAFLSNTFGVPGGIRTPDPLVRSQILYPAELQAHILNFKR